MLYKNPTVLQATINFNKSVPSKKATIEFSVIRENEIGFELIFWVSAVKRDLFAQTVNLVENFWSSFS